jgi:hypothetical protein
VPAAPARGALIVGNATPNWELLTLGAANTFFGSDGTDAAWTAPGALARVDDTNVTLTLSGSPLTALLRSATMTLGWTGQLSIARGGTGQATQTSAFDALAPTTTAGDLIYYNGTDNVRLGIGAAATLLQVNGSATPAWAALSGDATLAVGGALTLATVNANVGTFGSATQVSQITVNAKGLITAAANVTISGVAPSPHALLGTSHSDTTTQTPSRGSLIVGSASLLWDELTIGTVGKFLRTDGADASWQLLVAGDIPDLSAVYQPRDVDLDEIAAVANTTRGDMLVTNSGLNWIKLSLGAAGTLLRTSDGLDPTWGQVNLLSAFHGDTTADTVIRGDIITGQGASTKWNRLPTSATATRYLSNTGTSNEPAWAQVNLTNGVTGTLPIANGGTGQTTAVAAFDALAPTTTTGDMIYYDGTDNVRRSIGTSAQILQTNGSSTPTWASLSGDATVAVGGALTLTTVNSNVGTFGNSTNVSQVTVNAKGLITAVSNVAIAATSTSLFAERASQSLTAAGNTIVVTDGSPVTPITTTSNLTMTSVPTIANGRDGQYAILMNTGSNTLTLQDAGTLGGSNLRLTVATRTLSALRGCLALLYDSTMGGWVEQYLSNVLVFTASVATFTIDGSSADTREVAAASTADATPTFAITYVGVPSVSSIDIDAGGGEIVGSDYPISVPSPFLSLTSGTSPPSKAFNRGTSVAQVRTFTVTATVSGSAGLTRTCTVTYLNRRYAGPNSQSTLLSSAQVLALDDAGGTSDLTNSSFGSFTVTTSAGQYVWFAHRSALTTVSFFSVSSEIAGFSDMSTLSHTNDFGFVETFRAYRTTNTNFGSSKTVTTSSSRPTNRIYMGPSTNATSTILTAEILALDDTANGTSRLSATVPASYAVTITGSNYLWFCHASAITDLATIKDNSTGFAVSGSYRNNITHTNDMGFAETFRCWRSDNPAIFPTGGTVVVT